jgi:branched-chain amino acid transport system substrate-binding protein
MTAAARRALAALCVAALLPAARPAHGAEPVRVGVSLGLTGRYAEFAAMQQKGFRLWEDDVNARGGILGRPVRLEIRDDGGSVERARAIYAGLTGPERFDFVFAPFSSDLTEAVLPLTEARGYPLIVSGASADTLWQRGAHRLFGIFLPASKLTRSFLEMLMVHDAGRVGIVHAADPFSRLLAEGARTSAGRLGLEVALFEQLPADAAGYGAVARRATTAGVRVLLVCGYLEESIAVPRAARAAGYAGAFWVPVGLGLPRLFRELGPAAEGLFSTSQWSRHARDRAPAEVAFTNAFTARHGVEPSYFAATAYAAGELLEHAARQAGSLDRDGLARALAETEARTVIGRYGVDRNGVQVRNLNLVLQVRQGRGVTVWPEEQATAPPVLP